MSHCPHDLSPGSCADCTPRPRPLQPPDAAVYGPWFIADYHGSCHGCGDDIEPRDEIRADGTGHYLGRCCGGDDEPARPPRVLRDVELASWGPDLAGMGSFRRPGGSR